MRRRRRTAGRSLIVELMGPAGAGKTTLAEALSSSGTGVLVAPIPRLRSWKGLGFLVRNLLPLIPVIGLQRRSTRRLTWRETKRMVHLNGWHRSLARIDPDSGSVILLDHGPIYMLTTLLEFGPGVTEQDAFRRWWRKRLTHWASLLDLVVWLDALDSVLADRIDDRDHLHILKGRPQQEKEEFLDRYRSSFESVIAMAKECNDKLPVYRIRTEHQSTERVTEEVLRTIESLLNDTQQSG